VIEKPSFLYILICLYKKYVARVGDTVTQARVLHAMEQSGLKPTSKTYHFMLLCMRENLELERALDTFDLMKKQKIVPGLLSYLTMIDLALNLQQPEMASDLLMEAEKLNTFREKDQSYYMQVLRCAAYNGFVKYSCMCVSSNKY
jgi:pentatricopeptide repeat protein